MSQWFRFMFVRPGRPELRSRAFPRTSLFDIGQQDRLYRADRAELLQHNFATDHNTQTLRREALKLPLLSAVFA